MPEQYSVFSRNSANFKAINLSNTKLFFKALWKAFLGWKFAIYVFFIVLSFDRNKKKKKRKKKCEREVIGMLIWSISYFDWCATWTNNCMIVRLSFSQFSGSPTIAYAKRKLLNWSCISHSSVKRSNIIPSIYLMKHYQHCRMVNDLT